MTTSLPDVILKMSWLVIREKGKGFKREKYPCIVINPTLSFFPRYISTYIFLPTEKLQMDIKPRPVLSSPR